MIAPVEGAVEKNKPSIRMFFTGFIRIQGVLNWSAISFFGFLIGIKTLDIASIVVPFFFFAVLTFFILAFTFAVNNYYDIDTDKDNPRRVHLNMMASGRLSKQAGRLFNCLFIIIPLGLSLFYDRLVFVFCAGLIFLMWAYSAPPLRLKGRPGLDILWHFLVFFALILWGSSLAGSISLLSVLVGVSAGFFGCFAQIDNHLHDYAFDKASGSKTFAVWMGKQKASIALNISFILYLVFLIPLIVLFSLSSTLSILILCAGIGLSLIIITRKKKTGTQVLYYGIIFFGGAVYVTCLLFHLSSLL